MKLPAIALAACLLFVGRPATAAPLDLAALLKEAERHNPELVALRERVQAAEARIRPAAALPDPKLTAEWMELPQPTPKIQVSQMFMYPGKLSRMADMEAQMARMARQEFESRRWMVAADVQKAYYDLFYLDRLVAINQESQALLKDMIRVTNARYAVGRGMQADVLRPQLQLTKLLNDQFDYSERIQSNQARLKGLLGRSGEAPKEVPAGVQLTRLAMDRKVLVALAEQGPMLQMAQADVNRAEAALELAKLGYYPDFELGAGVAPSSGMEPRTSFSVMAGVTLPVWAAQKQVNQITEAERNLAAAQARIEARRHELDTQITTLINQISRMESQLKLLNEGSIPQARTALKANLAAYQSGRGDYLMMLDSFMALYDNRMQAAMLLSEHEAMIGMLEASVGQSLKGAN